MSTLSSHVSCTEDTARCEVIVLAAAALPLAPTNATPVVQRLWQGGRPKAGKYDFDLIVLSDDQYQPADSAFPGAKVYRVPLPDDWRTFTPVEREAAYARAAKAGETAAAWHRRGKRVLITCGAGLNRSGLITGIALRNLGYTATDAVVLIRKARGVRALGGKAFVTFITEYTPPKLSRAWKIVAGAALGVGAVLVGLFVYRRQK